MRQRKTKPAPRRVEEPVEPVEAAKTEPPDLSATDKLLDAIEEVLEVPPEEPKEKLSVEDYMAEILRVMAVPGPTFRDAMEQRRFYDLAERESRFESEPDDIPWEEIAKLPMPPPGGGTVVIAEPERIEWTTLRDERVCMKAPYRERTIHVSVEMWREAQFRAGPARRRGQRAHGDDGLCRICGWPSAGPPGPACKRRNMERAREVAMWPVMPVADPRNVCKITEA